MKRHHFDKCKKCTRTRRRGKTGGSSESTNVQPGWTCNNCASGGKRSRRQGKARRHSRGTKKTEAK